MGCINYEGAMVAGSAAYRPAGLGAIALGTVGGLLGGYYATQLGATLLDTN
jgi:hypothetical protein